MEAKIEIDFLMKQADNLLAQASNIAVAEVERLAREELKRNKKLVDFTMAMGTYFFSYGRHCKIAHEYKCKKLDDFILEYDNDLKMTGAPMSFTATGEKITNW